MGKVTPTLTSRKVLSVSYMTPLETLLATPETLPTSEPATPQIGYTVQSSHLPVFSFPPYSVKYIGRLIVAGRCTTAATIYWRMKKNGASVNSGSLAVSANTFFTVQPNFYDVSVGDVLELALWSSVSDSDWRYKAYCVYLTRLLPHPKKRLFMPLTFTNIAYPTLTLGNPFIANDAYLEPYFDDLAFTSPLRLGGGTKTYTVFYVKGVTYPYLFRTRSGDIDAPNNVQTRTHASYYPYYETCYTPSQLSWRWPILD